MTRASLLKAKLDSTRSAAPPPLPFPGSRLLNLEEAGRFRDLLLFAKAQVEGYFSGRHKSQRFGSDVEFAEYKEYVSGQDIGNIDWRIYGRTKRLFVRQYKEETDMVAYIMVDASASMQFRGRGLETKLLRAMKIAAVLAYLTAHQGDKVSLTLFSDSLGKHVPPGGTRRHLYHFLAELEGMKLGRTTDVARAVQECASVFKKRGCLILLSDLFGDTSALFESLAQFVHRRYQILLLQILDPDELDLPDVGATRFRDMETGEELEAEPEEIRAAYSAAMQARLAEIADRANQRHLRHYLIGTDRPYLQAIEAWLGYRGSVRR